MNRRNNLFWNLFKILPRGHGRGVFIFSYLSSVILRLSYLLYSDSHIFRLFLHMLPHEPYSLKVFSACTTCFLSKAVNHISFVPLHFNFSTFYRIPLENPTLWMRTIHDYIKYFFTIVSIIPLFSYAKIFFTAFLA